MVQAIDEPLISTFGRLVESFRTLEQRLAAELTASCGMTLTWFEVLLRLSRSPEGEMTMGDLARQMALTTGGITRLVDRMTSAGEVVRRRCATDRRVYYAAITPAGLTRVEQAAGAHAKSLERVFTGFTEEELGQLDGLLDRLRFAHSAAPVTSGE